MRYRTLLAAALMAALAFAPSMGRASTGVFVSASNNFFDKPQVEDANAGDTVTWDFQEGAHDVVAYQGATFNSGTRHVGERFQVPFNGGLVRYRCTLHSNVNVIASPPICSGMCGLISDAPVDVIAPAVAITSPADRAIVVVTPTVTQKGKVFFPVTITGTATDNVGVYGGWVRVFDSAGRGSQFDVTCDVCPGSSVRWSVTVEMQPGLYTVEAVAADPTGNRGTSRRIQFVVT